MDRDTKFCSDFRDMFEEEGINSVRLPPRSPNLTPHIERFMKSLKSEALDRLIFFGEKSLRRATTSYLLHYHEERNHQGLENKIIDPDDGIGNPDGKIECREHLGGLLRYYQRAA